MSRSVRCFSCAGGRSHTCDVRYYSISLNVRERLPKRLRRFAQLAKFFTLDARDVLIRKRQPMTPLRWQAWQVGSGDFHSVGTHLAQLLIEQVELQPHETVLDVGCGYGRAAAALTRYLTTGRYLGFDVSRRAIRWCRNNISTRYPNFAFDHVEVLSTHYHAHSGGPPERFAFPVPSGSIDVVLLASLLTHLRPPAAAQYIAETTRVLKPGGRALMTMFLIDDLNRDRLASLSPALTHWPEQWWAVMDTEDHEAAVGFERSVVEQAVRSRGLRISLISRGGWVSNPNALTYQDVVIARKEQPPTQVSGKR